MSRHEKTPRLAVAGLAAALAIAAILAQAPSPRAQSPAPRKEAKGATVPFELLPSNHMVVRAKLNGKGPYRLIFDLGAPITLLRNAASESSGVVRKSAPRSLLFAMRGEAKVDTMEVGELKAEGLPVIVLDHPALDALGSMLGQPLDGIIGFTFFARYKTTIDYQAKRMTFEPVDFEVKNLMKELPERLAGPKVARTKVLAPAALVGMTVAGESEGARVESVLPDSPAATAGLRSGDVLISLDGRWTTSVADTYTAASSLEPGRAVPAVVERDGRELTLILTPRAGF